MIKRFINLLGSVQVIVPLLIVITFVSLSGVIVPQGMPVAQYFQSMPGWRSMVIINLGLDHIFSTWWFYVLLGILAVNVVACSLTHQVRSLRNAGLVRFLHNPQDAAKLKCSTSFEADGDVKTVSDTITHAMQRRLFFCTQKPDENGTQIAARSLRLKEIGSLMFHLSILFFYVGGIISTMAGLSFVKEFKSGDVATVENWPYRVRCDGFKVERNAQGDVSAYKSTLTVLSPDSAKILTKVVEVNHPLAFSGVNFYQNSYGEQSGSFEVASLQVFAPGSDSNGYMTAARLNSPVKLPGDSITMTISRFISDFIIDMQSGEAASRSDRPNNPAVKVAITKGADTLYSGWTFVNYPDMHQESKKGYKVVFVGYEPCYYTGIKVSRNPGNPFIWFGFTFMTLGILLVFYFPHRNYWVFVCPGNARKVIVTVGGSSSRSASAFQAEFNHRCESLKRVLKEGAKS